MEGDGFVDPAPSLSCIAQTAAGKASGRPVAASKIEILKGWMVARRFPHCSSVSKLQ